MAYAANQRRVLVSSDRDFIRLHSKYIKVGKFHAGITYVLPGHKDDIGLIVQYMTDLHDLIEGSAAALEQDIYNQLVWL